MKKLSMNPARVAGTVKVLGLGLSTIAVLTACVSEPKYPGSHYFSPNTGAYPTAQTVDLSIPNDATNIFVTTDSVEPWPSEYCVQNNGLLQINVDQPMAIKLRYDQYGQTITDVGYYFIEDSAIDNGYKNRDLLDTWETFFASHVLKLFNVPDQDYSLLTHSDGQGGTVSLETRITERGWIFGDPEEGNQTYRFDNYHYTDPQTGQSFVIESGTIYGFRGESRGFYNTELDGEAIVFSGDINGWAEGNFKMDGERTTGGYYRVFCTDAGCANKEAVYGLNTTAKEFIEIAPVTNENTLSCSPSTS
ncbi:MAG: hypothetical protein MI867_10370 [Pseudomonadales bacterium]|nr:hypothetical protein [Pseudomonadales bacterium]